jgi:hypothetical protein
MWQLLLKRVCYKHAEIAEVLMPSFRDHPLHFLHTLFNSQDHHRFKGREPNTTSQWEEPVFTSPTAMSIGSQV